MVDFKSLTSQIVSKTLRCASTIAFACFGFLVPGKVEPPHYRVTSYFHPNNLHHCPRHVLFLAFSCLLRSFYLNSDLNLSSLLQLRGFYSCVGKGGRSGMLGSWIMCFHSCHDFRHFGSSVLRAFDFLWFTEVLLFICNLCMSVLGLDFHNAAMLNRCK